MFLVSATTYVSPESREAFMELARKAIEASRKEDGCIAYTCSADFTDPTAFHWFEAWRDVEAFNAHAQSPHHREFVAQLTVSGKVQRSRDSEAHYFEAGEIGHEDLVRKGVARVALPVPQEDGESTLAKLGFSEEEIRAASADQ